MILVRLFILITTLSLSAAHAQSGGYGEVPSPVPSGLPTETPTPTATPTLPPTPVPTPTVIITNPQINFVVNNSNSVSVSGICTSGIPVSVSAFAGDICIPAGGYGGSPSFATITSTVTACNAGNFSTSLNLNSATDGPLGLQAAQSNAGGTSTSDVCGTKRTDIPVVSITQSPALAIPSQSATMAAQVSGAAGPFTYQWSKNGATIAGATNSSYIVSSVQVRMPKDNYRVVVTNAAGAGNATKDLEVLVPPTSVSITPSGAIKEIGQSITFSLSASNGTGPFNYIWRKNGLTIDQSVVPTNAQSISLTRSNLQLNDAGNYSLVISNAAGSIESAISSLTVNAPTFTVSVSGPASVSVGENASFTAAVSGGVGAISYQWKKDGVDLAGETAATLSLTNVQTLAAGAYSVVATRSTRSIESSGASFQVVIPPTIPPTVSPSICDAPRKPQLILPTANQVNAALRPHFQWENVSDAATGSVTYDIQISTQGDCSLPVFSATDTSALSYELETGFSLQPDRNYFVCVNARGCEGTKNSGFSAPQRFTTRGDVKAPVLYTLPATSPSSPSGQKDIAVGGTGGEQGATARIFQRTADGDVEIGSTIVDANPQGRFEIQIDATKLQSGNGRREYVGIIERCIQAPCSSRNSANILESPLSDSVYYYYQNQLALRSPELTKTGDFTFDWKAIENATSYKVYRRVPNEACLRDSDGTGSACFKTSDFSFISTVMASACLNQGGEMRCAFSDTPSVSDQNKAAYGVAYFVTANNADTSSVRSRAVRFTLDNTLDPSLPATLPPITPNGVNTVFVPSSTGRSFKIYYCGVDTKGYLNSDLFPDLGAQVQYVSKNLTTGNTCDNFQYDPRSQSKLYSFDTLSLVTDIQASDRPCVFAAEVLNLDPSTEYCFKICQTDEAGRLESSCISQSSSTVQDGEAPEFAGLDSLIALSSGTALQPFWSLAIDSGTSADVSKDIVQYEVRTTKNIDVNGVPTFGNEIPVKLVKNSETTAVIEDLETDTLYCVQISALDNQGNRNTPEKSTLCAKTLNNKPIVTQISLSTEKKDDAYNVRVRFQVLDRLAGTPNHAVQFDAMEYRLSDGEWISVDSKHLTGFLSQYLLTAANANAPLNEMLWNTLPYFSGEQKIQVRIRVKDVQNSKDILGNTISTASQNTSTWGESNQETLFPGMTRIGAFGQESLSGCALTVNSNESTSSMAIILLLMTFVSLLAFRLSHQRKGKS